MSDVKLQQYILLAKGARGRALSEIIVKATSEPTNYGFAELLAVPNIQEIKAGEQAPYHVLLELFAFGTWADYKNQAANLPALNEAQSSKLKQLTVVSLALKTKVIPYALLQSSLEIGSVRELEDFIITECFYSGTVKGKLDQRKACLQVHDTMGRDVRDEDLEELDRGLCNWVAKAEGMMASIERQVAHTQHATELAEQKKREAEAATEDMKRNVKVEIDSRPENMALDEGAVFDIIEENRIVTAMAPQERAERYDSRVSGRRRLR